VPRPGLSVLRHSGTVTVVGSDGPSYRASRLAKTGARRGLPRGRGVAVAEEGGRVGRRGLIALKLISTGTGLVGHPSAFLEGRPPPDAPMSATFAKLFSSVCPRASDFAGHFSASMLVKTTIRSAR